MALARPVRSSLLDFRVREGSSGWVTAPLVGGGAVVLDEGVQSVEDRVVVDQWLLIFRGETEGRPYVVLPFLQVGVLKVEGCICLTGRLLGRLTIVFDQFLLLRLVVLPLRHIKDLHRV